MTHVRGHWRNGHYVRAHTRRGGTASGAALVVGAAILGYFLSTSLSREQLRPTLAASSMRDLKQNRNQTQG